MKKVCSKCGEKKPISKFGKRSAAKDGKNEWCKECVRNSSNRYREQNLEKCRKQSRDWRRKKRAEGSEEYHEALAAAHKKWYAKNREQCLARRKEIVAENRFYYALKNITRDAKKRGYMPCTATPEELEAAFTGRCAICGIYEDECSARLHVDHCHLTGRFRGHLCNNCNCGLSRFKDSEENLVNALHYLMNCHE